jgi:hypothetical protein
MEKRARSAIDLEVDSIRPAHAEAVWLQGGIGAIDLSSQLRELSGVGADGGQTKRKAGSEVARLGDLRNS